MKFIVSPADRVGPMGDKQGLMRRLMDQVGGEHHGMGAQQHADDIAARRSAHP